MSFLRTLYRSFNRKERITFYAATAGILLGLAGLVVFIFTRYTVSVPAAGGEYREGIVGQPASINPVLARSAADKAMVKLTFSGAAALAETIEPTDKGRSFRLHLKDGLVWSDGREITADDVIFTMQAIQDKAADSPLAPSWQGITAERVSKLEVLFKLPVPYAMFGHTISSLPVVPKHLFSEVPVQNWRLSDYILRPVGSGPYIAASYEREEDGFINTYRLRANPAYKGNRPFLEELTLRFFRNREDLLREFNAGKVDGFFAEDPALLADIERPYQTAKFTTPTVYAVFWNQSSNTALASRSVREALRLMIDREALAKDLLEGYGSVASDPLSPFFLAPNMATSSVEAGKELLRKEGWSLNDEGVFSKKKGQTETRLELTLTVPDTLLLRKTAERLERDWRAAGVPVKLNILPLETILSEQIKNRTYEALLFGNTVEESGDLFAFWHSSERFSPGLNLALYRNSKADTLLESMRTEPDPEKRKVSMEALARMIAADDPALFLFSPEEVQVTAKRVRGIAGGKIVDPSDRFREVERWHVETRRSTR